MAFRSLDNSWGCSPRGAPPRTFSAQTHLFHRKIENLGICDTCKLCFYTQNLGHYEEEMNANVRPMISAYALINYQDHL